VVDFPKVVFLPPLTFARVRGRAVARLPRSRVGRWPFQLAHLVIRRLRRPPRGLSCRGAFWSLSKPVHRLTRCVVSGVLAGSAGHPPIARLRPSSLGTSRPSSGPSSGSLRERPLLPPCRRRSVSPRFDAPRCFGGANTTRSTRSVLVVRFHLDGLLRSRPPACRSWHQIWGSPGWSLVDRCCSSGLAAGRPPRIVREMPLCAMPCEGLFLVDSRSRITAACSPPVVHRLLRTLSRPLSASFRTDRSPWAVRSAPSPSSLAFLPRPADGPEVFPLGCARCPPSPVARRRRVGHSRLRVESRPSAFPRGFARADDADPRSRTPRGVVRPVGSLRHWLIETGVLLLRFPPSRVGGWLESPRSNEISRTARPPFSIEGSFRFLRE